MKQSFQLEDLDCAICANKMEESIKKIPGVVNCSVSFIMQKLTIETIDENTGDIMDKVIKVCHKVEPDCTIIR